MKILNMRRQGRFALVYKGRALGPTTTNAPLIVYFDKEEERDEASRKLAKLVAHRYGHANPSR